MNQEQQRIAIAEWMGWLETHQQLLMGVHPSNAEYLRIHNEAPLENLPNYPIDLNACHEMERKLSEKQAVWYLQRLAQVRLRQGHGGMIACMIDKLAFATSQQRSEALCRTLWPERF